MWISIYAIIFFEIYCVNKKQNSGLIYSGRKRK